MKTVYTGLVHRTGYTGDYPNNPFIIPTSPGG